MPLTPKQIEFCEQYLIDRNATQAAIRAGYSEKVAKQQGSRLLSYADVKARIEQKTAKHLQKLEISQERVMELYAMMANHDPRKIYNADGSIKPVTQWNDAEAFSLTGLDLDQITETTGGKTKKTTRRTVVTKIKFTDRKGLLDSIARMGGYEVPKGPAGGTAGELKVPFDMSKYSNEDLKVLAKGFRK